MGLSAKGVCAGISADKIGARAVGKKIARKKENYSRKKIFEHTVANFLCTLKFKSILLYLPLFIEADTKKIIRILRTNRKAVYVPFIEGVSFKMVRYRLPEITGDFNIQTCRNSFVKINKIDIMIIPALGVDRNFKRIGHGKGMYDRFVEKIKNTPLTIFAQKKICYFDADICEKHDVSADFLTAEGKIFQRGKINNVNYCANRSRRNGNIRYCRIFDGKKNRFRKISNIYRAVKIKSKGD